MNSKELNPPRWAEAVLRSLLTPIDREPVSGDLVSEYRETRRPSLGAARANAWYIKHVVSVWWHLIRPFAAVLIAQSVLLSITVFRPGHHAPNFRPAGPSFMFRVVEGIMYGSVMPAPGVSFFDALIYFAAGSYGYQRTRLIRTSVLIAGSTSVVGIGALFVAAALITPSLMRAPFANPFIFFILSVYLMIPLTYGVLLGALAGVVGKWVAPFAPRDFGVS